VRFFIERKGVELLYLRLKDFLLAGTGEEIELQIINYSVKLLYEYFLRCFADKRAC
jgi:hypothetical protein